MITKNANVLLNILKGIGTVGHAFGKHTAAAADAGHTLGRGIGIGARAAGEGAKMLYRGVVGPALRGTTRAGKYMVTKHPGITAVTGGVGLLSALTFPSQFRKNLVHTDHTQNLTRQGILSLDYRSPLAKQRAQEIFGDNVIY